jgi:ATP-dependent RNA helicase DeaD
VSDDAEEPTPTGFAELGLRPELLTALTELGYEEPTPIQREAIPPVLAGRDLLGQAATGTGKTAAFALPVLQRLGTSTGMAPRALILVPTRELAMQVSEAVHRYGRGLGARVLPVYGGQPIVRQLQALSRGVDIVVATPGRAVDHLNRGSLPLATIESVVLDEADEMLDMGFAEDIETLLGAVTGEHQTVLFSATLPARIGGIARRHLHDPVRIEIGRPVPAAGGGPLVRQTAYMVARAHKPAALGRVLDVEGPAAALVFCRTRNEVDELTETLKGRGYRAEALHGGMDQSQRDRVMSRLRAGTADLLIATDVAARGLDIDHLSHVVNYDVPSAPETYVHRIGRIGRAGREGVAITLAEPREHRLLKNIERLLGERITVDKVPTGADLRNRRLEQTLGLLRAALDRADADEPAEGDREETDQGLDEYRVVIDALSDDHDLAEIALAAVHLLHESTAGGAHEDDIPDAAPPKPGAGGKTPRGAAGTTGKGGRPAQTGPRTRLWISAGRVAGIRPADLVGAIANETSLSGRDIGPIEINERYSIVEVPAAAAAEVIAAVGASTIKGRKATVRRER